MSSSPGPSIASRRAFLAPLALAQFVYGIGALVSALALVGLAAALRLPSSPPVASPAEPQAVAA